MNEFTKTVEEMNKVNTGQQFKLRGSNEGQAFTLRDHFAEAADKHNQNEI